jgi:proteasome lid subunit RPN8/RPN11
VTPAARVHPGPAVARVPAAILAVVVAQAVAEAPLEACGLIVGDRPIADGGEALRYAPCRNVLASRSRFSIHPDDLYRVTVDADDAGEVVWGLVHSHPHSPAVPSPTDTELALYPDALHLVVSLADATRPELRAWRIVDGAAHEVALEPA